MLPHLAGDFGFHRAFEGQTSEVAGGREASRGQQRLGISDSLFGEVLKIFP